MDVLKVFIPWFGLLLGVLIIQSRAEDVVYAPVDNYAMPGEERYDRHGDTYGMETTPGYTEQVNNINDARLNCFDCTSYMPSCKRVVSDREGLIVSRAGCKSKCFLRVGEEKSGALYRGCMDDFLSAGLTTEYVGCKVQEWNGRKTLWCLCDDDLCNGESLKSLFYYGYDKGAATVGIEEPAKTAYLEPMDSVDAEFDQMTGSLHNFNPHYELEPKSVDKELLQGNGDISEEPLLEDLDLSQELLPDYSEPIEEPEEEEVMSKYDIKSMETNFREELHQPDPHYLPPGGVKHNQGKPAHAPSQEVQYPADGGYTIDPTNGGQYPPPIPPYDGPVFYFPPPGFHPYLSSFPPQLNNQIKQSDAFDAPPPPVSYTQKEDPLSMPEGKSADPFPSFDKYGPVPVQDYQYSYHEGPADFDLEQVSYFPYEEREETHQVEEISRPDRHSRYEEEITEHVVTQEEVIDADVDTNLFCPSAGIFTYELDCSKFVMCLIDHIKGRPRMYIMKCPAGLVFDSIANTCMQPEMSDGCKRLTPEERGLIYDETQHKEEERERMDFMVTEDEPINVVYDIDDKYMSK